MLCSSCPAVAEFANGQNLVVPQPVLDFTHTVAPHIHGENLLDNMGRFRVGDKMIFILRVNQIPIGSFTINTLPPLGLGLLHSPDFLGGIAGVKLIKPVSQRGKFVIFPRCVHAVVDGNIPHIVLRENDFDEFPGFQIVPAQAG